MIYQATQAIADRFREKEIRFKLEENEKTSRIIAQVSGEYSFYTVQFTSSDDDNDVSVRVFNFVKFPADRKREILRLTNELNNRYRYMKFVADIEEELVRLEYDFPVSNQDPAETAVESFFRFMKLADEAYPDFMRLIWGGSNAPGSADSDIHDVLFTETEEQEEGSDSET